MATVIGVGTDMTLKINSVDYSEQVSMVELTVDQEVDTYRTLTGKKKVVTGKNAQLKVKMFQDWPGNATGDSEKLWALATAGTAVAFEFTIGGTGGGKWTGNVIPVFPTAGGTPGQGLESDMTMEVDGDVTFTPNPA